MCVLVVVALRGAPGGRPGGLFFLCRIFLGSGSPGLWPWTLHPGKHPPFYVLGQWERQWDYDLVSLAADARVTLDANLVGLQVRCGLTPSERHSE